jgi:hypothetical protein
VLAFHGDFAVVGHARHDLGGDVQRAHEHAGAAVDEAGHQPLVEGVAQAVLELAGARLPFAGVAQPVGRLAT